MNLRKLTTLLLISICSPAIAQDSLAEKVNPIRITSLWFGTGAQLSTMESGGPATFRLLAPGSVFLANDFTGYSESRWNALTANSSFSALAGFQFGNRKKEAYKINPVMRIGLHYSSSSWIQGYVQKDSLFFRDTLTSSQTGQSFYIDSVMTTGYAMDYNSDQLRLDVSAIFSTNPGLRWSFFSGFGLQGGISLQAQTSVSYFQTVFARTQNQGSFNSSNNYVRSTMQQETIRHSGNYYVGAYLPIGVDFRIGKKRELLRMFHLFAETRPSVGYKHIRGYGGGVGVSTQFLSGIKASF